MFCTISAFDVLIVPKNLNKNLSLITIQNVLNRSTHYLYFGNAANTVSKTMQIIKHAILSRGLHFTALTRATKVIKRKENYVI